MSNDVNGKRRRRHIVTNPYTNTKRRTGQTKDATTFSINDSAGKKLDDARIQVPLNSDERKIRNDHCTALSGDDHDGRKHSVFDAVNGTIQNLNPYLHSKTRNMGGTVKKKEEEGQEGTSMSRATVNRQRNPYLRQTSLPTTRPTSCTTGSATTSITYEKDNIDDKRNQQCVTSYSSIKPPAPQPLSKTNSRIKNPTAYRTIVNPYAKMTVSVTNKSNVDYSWKSALTDTKNEGKPRENAWVLKGIQSENRSSQTYNVTGQDTLIQASSLREADWNNNIENVTMMKKSFLDNQPQQCDQVCFSSPENPEPRRTTSVSSKLSQPLGIHAKKSNCAAIKTDQYNQTESSSLISNSNRNIEWEGRERGMENEEYVSNGIIGNTSETIKQPVEQSVSMGMIRKIVNPYAKVGTKIVPNSEMISNEIKNRGICNESASTNKINKIAKRIEEYHPSRIGMYKMNKVLASSSGSVRNSNIHVSSGVVINPYTKVTNSASTEKVLETELLNKHEANKIKAQQEHETQDELKCLDKKKHLSIQCANICQMPDECSNTPTSNNVELPSSKARQDSPRNKENNEAKILSENPSCTELENTRVMGKDEDKSHDCSVPRSNGCNKENGSLLNTHDLHLKISSSTGADGGIRQHNSCRQDRNEVLTLPPDLIYDKERIQPVDDENRQRLIKEAQLNDTLKNGWKILPHQKAGILRGLLMRRIVLAFDMGLGKTLIGCVWAKAFKRTFPDIKVYIVCPVTLKKEWRRTALEATGLHCEEEKKGKEGKKSDESDSLNICICSWAKVPTKVPNSLNYVVIGDEAHNMQSMEAARTKNMLKLVLSKRCKGVLLLTGTPMKNGKPANLFPLLRATSHPFGDDQMTYETQFCNGQQKRVGPGCGRLVWDVNGSSNLDLLNSHISSHVFYKTKDDCLKELPKKTREYQDVPVSSRYELQHTNAMRKLANAVRNMVEGNSDCNEAMLGAFAGVRQVSSFAKVDATVALAKCILEKEASIVIFTFFISIAKKVHEKLKESGWSGELLTGETATSKRQAMVENFQRGISPVFVATFGAGGVGITLTAACTVILLDRPWTPGDALQAEDRVRRIGQTRPVKSIWMRAFQVDQQIDKMIEQKDQNSSAVVDGRQSSYTNNQDMNKSASAPKVSILELIKSVIKNV